MMATEKHLKEIQEHYALLVVIAEELLTIYEDKYPDINVMLIVSAMESCSFMYPDGFGEFQLEMAIEEEIATLDKIGIC
jgi:hypothetical protein